MNAQATADAAAENAEAQRKKAALARETVSFEHRANHAREEHVITQTARDLPQAQPVPTAPPQHLVEEPAVAASPPRTNRAIGLVATWYPQQYMPTCFGGNGGSNSRSSREVASRRRKPQL